MIVEEWAPNEYQASFELYRDRISKGIRRDFTSTSAHHSAATSIEYAHQGLPGLGNRREFDRDGGMGSDIRRSKGMMVGRVAMGYDGESRSRSHRMRARSFMKVLLRVSCCSFQGYVWSLGQIRQPGYPQSRAVGCYWARAPSR